MQQTIKIQEIDIQFTKKGKNGWHTAEVTYTDEDKGKNFTKKLQSFKNPKVFGVIQEANPGDRFEVEVKKEGDFYEWVAINEASEQAAPSRSRSSVKPAAAESSGGRKGDWETAEERARKQVYIVKQSSISAAIALLGSGADFDAVRELAQKFTDFVFESEDDEDMGPMDSED